MRFVTLTDFDDVPYTIPNLDKVANNFEPYATKKEDEILSYLLGELQYDSFIEGLDALPDAYSSTVATEINKEYYYGVDIWKALTVTTGTLPVEGLDWELIEEGNKWLKLRDGYTYSTSRKWGGVKEMLIPFIYSEWLTDDRNKFSGVGVVIPKAENSNVISPKYAISRAWNDFAHFAGTGCSKRNSLYGFCKANEDLYPDFCFGDPGRKNVFNL